MSASRVLPALPISRATFLRGAAAGVAAVTAPNLLTTPAAAADTAAARVSPALSPLQLDFSLIERFRLFQLLSPGFVAVDRRFDAATGAGMVRTGHRPPAPFCSVIADVASAPTASSGTAGVVLGLVANADLSVTAAFEVSGSDATAGTVSIDIVRNGKRHRVDTGTVNLRPADRYAFSLQENYVTALVGYGEDWLPVANVRISDLEGFDGFDLADPDRLARMRYAYGVTGDGAEAHITRVQAGLFGEAGLRDPHVVTYADGTPLIRDGWVYFTTTNAGLAFFQAAHWGVWRMNLDDPTDVEQLAHIYWHRDGRLLGDHAGHIVIDDDGSFHVAVSGWGDFDFEGVKIRYTHTTENILSGVHVLRSAVVDLPLQRGTEGVWDPHMVRIGGRWYVAFVESPFQDPEDGFDFHPALARGPIGVASPARRLGRVGADLTRHQTEGTIMQKIGNKWYVLASDGDAREYRVYDLQMRFLGLLDAPYGSNIPHPMIFPVYRAGRTSYMWITFNGGQFREPVLGYGTHGSLLVLKARQTVSGREFPPHR